MVWLACQKTNWNEFTDYMDREIESEQRESIFPPGSHLFFDNFEQIQKFSETGNPENVVENPEAFLGLCDLLYNFKDDKDAKALRKINKDSQPLFKKKSSKPLRTQAFRNNAEQIEDLLGAILEEFSENEENDDEQSEDEESDDDKNSGEGFEFYDQEEE